ncbi:MAG: hypothetical protein U9P14_08665 [Gemmatimonadota bacterium]|nr:hypothetical protein [Gemmatimonadota bacterium]
MEIIEDYMDADVAYLMGLIIARGTLEPSPQRKLILHFPKSNMEATGIELSFDQEISIRLGLDSIRERISELLGTAIKTEINQNSVDLIIDFSSNNMVWRNILLLTKKATSYRHFSIPDIFFNPDLPKDWKTEFIKGYGDSAGNVRKANLYVDGRHRVRLDVLNYPTNWELPIQLCHLLQEQIGVPVLNINWGHPNLNRDFREHQINIFADAYLKIGFSFEHKQKILEELANWNKEEKPNSKPTECPSHGARYKKKKKNPEEKNAEKLDLRLVGKHFDGYRQICKRLGCKRRPSVKGQTAFHFEEDAD